LKQERTEDFIMSNNKDITPKTILKQERTEDFIMSNNKDNTKDDFEAGEN